MAYRLFWLLKPVMGSKLLWLLLLWTQVFSVGTCMWMYSSFIVCVLTGFVPALMAFIIVLQLCIPWWRRLSFQLIFMQIVLTIRNCNLQLHVAKALPAVLVRDRAATTVATYLHSYKSWKSWASRHDAAFLPADSVVFTLYVVSLIQQTRSVSSVNSAVYGVSWVHRKCNF